MLDLAPDTDTRLLCDTLLDKTGPVVLTGEQEQAYTRFIDRVLAVRRNDPLDRFLHRGR